MQVRTTDYTIRTATSADVPPARAVMLDTVYRDFRTGYVPRWHGDVIDPAGAYLTPARHTLLVAVAADGEVVGTGALDSRGPAHPRTPARRRAVPLGSDRAAAADLRPARAPSARAGAEARRRAAGVRRRRRGYRAVYLHTDPAVTGAEPFWRSLAKVVHDEREDAGGGQGIVHFEVPMAGWRGAR